VKYVKITLLILLIVLIKHLPKCVRRNIVPVFGILLAKNRQLVLKPNQNISVIKFPINNAYSIQLAELGYAQIAQPKLHATNLTKILNT